MATRTIYDTQEWKRLRKQALLRDHFACTVCGANVSRPGHSRVDHIQPVSTHPRLALSLSNVRTLCLLHDNQAHREKGRLPGTPREARFSGCDASGMPFDRGHHWRTEQPPRQRSTRNPESATHPNWIAPSLVPVHLVCGPPAAGKTTFVRNRAGKDDLVLDLDVIMAGLSGKPSHAEWDRHEWLGPALAKRNELLASLSTPSNWRQVWLIVGEPTAQGRAWWRTTLGLGQTYVIATPIAECLARIAADSSRRAVADQHREAVAKWWREYRPAVGDTLA